MPSSERSNARAVEYFKLGPRLRGDDGELLMERREFVSFCVATAAAAGAPASFSTLAADSQPRLYSRSRLVDAKGAPILGKSIPPERNLIFNYPYAATPCFLLNLGRPAAAATHLQTASKQSYAWHGGVGASRSIVAYSAICAHKLTYPTKDISFISYRAEKSARNRFGSVIHCCSEHSQYDPAEGARVVAGPAPQPLAAILLEWRQCRNRFCNPQQRREKGPRAGRAPPDALRLAAAVTGPHRKELAVERQRCLW